MKVRKNYVLEYDLNIKGNQVTIDNLSLKEGKWIELIDIEKDFIIKGQKEFVSIARHENGELHAYYKDKTIYNMLVEGNVFKFIDKGEVYTFAELLEYCY